jgi:NAD+ synthase (glutamine-hydrolysing)
VVGLPLAVDGRLFNCAAFLASGRLVGIVPKTFLPTTNEFYEARWFTSAAQGTPATVTIAGEEFPFGADLIFPAANLPGCVVGIEVCEDLWAVNPPSGRLALAGATVLVNPSASNELLGKAEYRRDLIRQQSARCLAAYCYAGVGSGESTTDTVYAGHALIAENGGLLVETPRFSFATQMAVADIDVQRLVHERLRNSSFSQAGLAQGYRPVSFTLPRAEALAPTPVIRPGLFRHALRPRRPGAPRAPLPGDFRHPVDWGWRSGCATPVRQSVVIGVSGGLDSTLALLVIVAAFDRLGLPRENIVAITMPGFGTTQRTRGNAERLAELDLGVTLRVIPIAESVRQHFRDIGHDEQQHDVTYENAQARERTQILMDVANQVGGLVVGTGDLSEAALGWMTFNGDHMSMYHVNAGVPKTLVRYLVGWCADELYTGETTAVLRRHRGHADHAGTAPAGAPTSSWRRRPKRRSAPTTCTTFSSSQVAAPPVWAGEGLLPGAPGFRRLRTTRLRSCAGRRSSIGASSASSSSVRPCPTARRSARVALSPARGTGGCPATPSARCGWRRWSG